MERRAPSPSPSSSSQQLPQIRTDTDTSSVRNASSLDPATKSLSATATRTSVPSTTRTAVQTASANVSTSRPSVAVSADPLKPQGPHFPSHPMSSANFPVSNTSMSFSSVDDAGNPRLRGNNNHNRSSPGGRGDRQSPPQRRHSGDNSVMDAVSRSLNAHNDPELEGLPPMGDESSADGSTLLYEKGFLISTSPGADRDPGAGSTSGHNYIPAHPHDEEQQQRQQQRENSASDVSRSRGPTVNTSGISHRFLTAEEIEERRRATSRPVSHATSHAQPGVADTNNSVNLSASGKPTHRQLSKEETEKLISQRQRQFKEEEQLKQQQRAAAAATAAADAAATRTSSSGEATAAATNAASTRQPTSPPQQRTSPKKNNTNNASASGSAPLNSNATPWLMTGDGSAAALPHSQTGHPAAAEAARGTMTFEWLQGTSAGVGGFVDASGTAWSGDAPWRDAAAALNPVFFPGGTTTASGDGGATGSQLTIANVAAAAGAGGGGYTWLPNASYWSTLEQQQQQQLQQPLEQQQQQQQLQASALIPSMASRTVTASTHDPLTFIGGPQTLMSTAGPLGSGSVAFAGPLAGITMSLIQSLPTGQLEAGIRQCDDQIVRAQQDREALYHELQRRQYAMMGSTNNNNISIASGIASGSAAGANVESMSWPGALHTTTTATTATGVTASNTAAGPASTGSPSRFFGGPGVEGRSLPHMLDVPTSVLHTTTALNFSTTASAGASSMNAAAARTASERRNNGSDGPGAASTGPPSSKSAVTGGGRPQGERQQHNNNSSSTASRGQRHGSHQRGHNSLTDKSHRGGGGRHHNNSTTSPSFGAAAASGSVGGAATGGTRCSHDNTPQEQKYLQTDPFSMYEHNKKIATTAATKEASA